MRDARQRIPSRDKYHVPCATCRKMTWSHARALLERRIPGSHSTPWPRYLHSLVLWLRSSFVLDTFPYSCNAHRTWFWGQTPSSANDLVERAARHGFHLSAKILLRGTRRVDTYLYRRENAPAPLSPLRAPALFPPRHSEGTNDGKQPMSGWRSTRTKCRGATATSCER